MIEQEQRLGRLGVELDRSTDCAQRAELARVALVQELGVEKRRVAELEKKAQQLESHLHRLGEELRKSESRFLGLLKCQRCP